MKSSSLSLLATTLATSNAFVPPQQPAVSTSLASTPTPSKNLPEWDTKQHLYGLDMVDASGANSITVNPEGEIEAKSLPLPETYVTCGKCKSLFVIAESDLGTQGKGCRVKCSVCSNSWYQSRDRLFDIPTNGYEMGPAPKSDIDRIARNLAADHAPDFYGINKLYVGNLDYSTTPDDLLKFFEDGTEDCKVCDTTIVSGPDGRPRGFGFVSFYPGSSLEAALEMNGKECNGRELSVKEPNN